MKFGQPHLLWALLIVPILIVVYTIDGQRRRRLYEKLGSAATIAIMVGTMSKAKRRWNAVLTTLAVTCLLLALARPQLPGRARLTQQRGLDLVVALDFSRSMLAKDIYPSRLERAKAELSRLLDSLKGDRVGLVAFAGETLSYPLTVDYDAAKLFWRDFTPDDMPVGGTNIGLAIRQATDLLVRVRKKDEKNKAAQVILLLTDGEDTDGDAIAATREAAKQKIRIYPVGIGSNEPQYVQLYDEAGRPAGFLTDSAGKAVRVGLDEASLRQIATLTDGEYIPPMNAELGLERFRVALDALERTSADSRLEREPDDVGRFLIVPGFIFLLWGAWLKEKRKRTFVEGTTQTQRGLATIILLCALPMLTGFDFFKRRDPNVEEGNRLLDAGKAAEALKEYDKALTRLPEDPVVHYDRGTALYSLGKFADAQKEFQRSTEAHAQPLKADAYYNLGNAQAKQDHWQEALDAYRHSLSLRPEDPRAKWNLELALRRLKAQPPKPDQQPNDKKSQDKKDQQQPDAQQQPQPGKDGKQQDKQQQDQQAQDDKQQKDKAQQDKQAQKDKAQQEKAQAEQAKQDKANPELGKQEQPKPEADKAKAVQTVREIDKHDAESVLDALERVEPTVQKDLAKRRAANRRPKKDW